MLISAAAVRPVLPHQPRELRTREPFRPFEVHLNDGNRFHIRGPMDLMVTRAGDIALVDD